MIYRKESAAEIAMRLRLGISPHRPFVWIESIDGKRAAQVGRSGNRRDGETGLGPKDEHAVAEGGRRP